MQDTTSEANNTKDNENVFKDKVAQLAKDYGIEKYRLLIDDDIDESKKPKNAYNESVVSEVFVEKSISDSVLYQDFNLSNDLLKTLLEARKFSIPVTDDMIEEQLLQIKRSHISPMISTILEAYQTKKIELVYSEKIKVPKSIPFIVWKMGNTLSSNVFVSAFARLDKDMTTLDIPMKNLYILLESSYLALQYHSASYKILRNMSLMKICMTIYTEMQLRILNKEYALSLDKSLYDRVVFSISYFFVKNVWELGTTSNIVNYAIGACLNPDTNDLENVYLSYQEADIKNFYELLEFIKNLSPRMESLTKRYYIESYIRMYQGIGLLSLDYLPYLFLVIINVLAGGFLVSQNSLSDIVRKTKGINSFYAELLKIV